MVKYKSFFKFLSIAIRFLKCFINLLFFKKNFFLYQNFHPTGSIVHDSPRFEVMSAQEFEVMITVESEFYIGDVQANFQLPIFTLLTKYNFNSLGKKKKLFDMAIYLKYHPCVTSQVKRYFHRLV